MQSKRKNWIQIYEMQTMSELGKRKNRLKKLKKKQNINVKMWTKDH